MHSLNIVHRDIKPENILISNDGNIKIADFCSSKIIRKNDSSTPYIVSRFYRAPELILGQTKYDGKIDIFSAGCIIGELFSQFPLFRCEMEGFQILEQICILGNPGKSYFDKFDLPNDIKKILASAKLDNLVKINDILNDKGIYKKADIDLAADLIIKMLRFAQEKRLTADQCLKHPFLLKNNH